MNSRGLRLACCGLLLVAGSMADRASAYCRMTTEGGAQVAGAPCVEKGAPLFWAVPCLSYAIDSDASAFMTYSEVEQAVDASFATWQSADCGSGENPNLVFQPLPPSNCQRAECNPDGNVNTIAFLNPWKDECAADDKPGYDQWAFAVTIVWHNTSTGEILDADMMINDLTATQFNAGGPYANCPETGCPEGGVGRLGPADLASIVTHEAGHFVGIGHSDLEGATMYASAVRSSVEKRDLAADDIEAVCDIYPPGDLESTCEATILGGLQLDCSANECGGAQCSSGGGSNSGCSATGTPGGAPWASLLAALFGLTVLQRRSRRHAARS